jgi:hypothetical protein
MRKIYSITLLASALMLGSGCASEGMKRLSIQDALQYKGTKRTIDPSIHLSFGDQGHSGKEWTANRKTNGVNKSAEEACKIAFLSAVIALQDRAKKEGKTSVIDIYSYYKKKKFSSPTEYECEDGSIMNGVALRGKVQ